MKPKKNLVLPLVFLLLGGSCANQPQETNESLAYECLTIKADTVTLSESYTATIQGCQDVEICPQISGTISRLCIKEGERVKKGQVLFVIDQVPYQSALHIAVANTHALKAQLKTAELDYKSKQTLFKENVISDYDLTVAKNAVAIAQSHLEQAKAEETKARNELSYTEIKSPSNGVVGTIPYRVGALVGPNISKPLTTVSDNSQMYVYFSMTESQLRILFNQYGSPDRAISNMPNVKLQLNDGALYPQSGHIETISGIINPQTGTASVRGVFPNADRLLFSGGSGSIILPYTLKGAIVVPQSATYELQDKVFVYKVINGVAVSTELKVERINDGNNYVVLGGLKSGDEIVSKGIGQIQDGMKLSDK